jgi:hypothetical protein
MLNPLKVKRLRINQKRNPCTTGCRGNVNSTTANRDMSIDNDTVWSRWSARLPIEPVDPSQQRSILEGCSDQQLSHVRGQLLSLRRA